MSSLFLNNKKPTLAQTKAMTNAVLEMSAPVKDYSRYKPEDMNKTINGHLYKAIKKRREQEKPRGYLGASGLGTSCMRSLYFERIGAPQDHFAFKTNIAMDLGHVVEDYVANLFKDAGYRLHTLNKEGKQFGFSQANGEFKGHVDGVFSSGPKKLPYPVGWEHKFLCNKRFNAFVNSGLEIAEPTYYAQVQSYMAYSPLYWEEQITSCLVTVTNADTKEVWHDLVHFNPSYAQQLTNKAVRVLKAESEEELERVGFTPDFWQCKNCKYRTHCWRNNNA